MYTAFFPPFICDFLFSKQNCTFTADFLNKHRCESHTKKRKPTTSSNALTPEQIPYPNAYTLEWQRSSSTELRAQRNLPRAFRTKRNLPPVTRLRNGIIDFLTKILSLKAAFHVPLARRQSFQLSLSFERGAGIHRNRTSYTLE